MMWKSLTEQNIEFAETSCWEKQPDEGLPIIISSLINTSVFMRCKKDMD